MTREKIFETPRERFARRTNRAIVGIAIFSGIGLFGALKSEPIVDFVDNVLSLNLSEEAKHKASTAIAAFGLGTIVTTVGIGAAYNVVQERRCAQEEKKLKENSHRILPLISFNSLDMQDVLKGAEKNTKEVIQYATASTHKLLTVTLPVLTGQVMDNLNGLQGFLDNKSNEISVYRASLDPNAPDYREKMQRFIDAKFEEAEQYQKQFPELSLDKI